MSECNDEPKRSEVEQRRSVIVKFKRNRNLPYVDDPNRNFPCKEDRQRWEEISREFGGIRLLRSFPGTTRGALARSVERAQARDCRYRFSVEDFFFYTIGVPRDGFDPERLVRTLLEWDAVQSAYVRSSGVLPGYMDAAPNGIGVQSAHASYDTDGAEVTIGIIERGWTLMQPLNVGDGVPVADRAINSATDTLHGDAVLTVVSNIAPAATVKLFSSWYQNPGESPQADVARTIEYILRNDHLSPGDILLVEEQIRNENPGKSNYLPVEQDAATFLEIRTATATDILVIEPTGNYEGFGAVPPQTWLDHGDNSIPGEIDGVSGRPLSGPPPALDSEALMVSACGSPPAGATRCARRKDANYGTRVDCYGLGDSAGGVNKTSAAAAIIGGAAALIQSKSIDLVGHPQSPYRVREFMRRPGTPVVSPGKALDASATPEGYLPNLDSLLGLPASEWNDPVT